LIPKKVCAISVTGVLFVMLSIRTAALASSITTPSAGFSVIMSGLYSISSTVSRLTLPNFAFSSHPPVGVASGEVARKALNTPTVVRQPTALLAYL